MKNLNLKFESLKSSYVPVFLNSSKDKIGEMFTSLTQSESDYLTKTENTDSDIKELLKSKMDIEVILGLKFLLIYILKGKDITNFCTEVLNLCISNNFYVRKLCLNVIDYLSLKKRNELILLYNLISKYINDNNPIHRWNVIHIATSLRNQSISLECSKQIVPFFTDSNPIIRRLAIIALVHYVKAFNSNNQNICLSEEDLTSILKKYVNDPHPLIFSSAFYAICEIQNKDYLSYNFPMAFTYICQNLSKIDDFYYERVLFSLINFSNLFIFNNFDKNYKHFKTLFDSIYKCIKYTTNNSKILASGFALYEMIYSVHKLNLNKISIEEHQLFKNNKQLVNISNILVKILLSSKRDYEKYLSLQLILKFLNNTHNNNMVKPLENFFYIIRSNIQKHFNIFFLLYSNKEYINKKYLEVLISLSNETNIKQILEEFRRNLIYPNLNLKKSIIDSIYKICILHSNRSSSINNNITSLCIEKLIEFLKLKEEGIISQIIICLRKLILEIKEHTKFVLIYNIKNYRKNVTSATAKANIIWMISQFINVIPTVSVDFFRRILIEIDNESDEVKFQILSFAMRIHSNIDLISRNYPEDSRGLIAGRIKGLIEYAIEKLLWDNNYNIREKSRMVNFTIQNNLHNKENDFLTNYKKHEEKKQSKVETEENRKKLNKYIFALSIMSNTSNITLPFDNKFNFDQLEKNLNHQLFLITLDDIISLNKHEENEAKNTNNNSNTMKLDNQKYVSIKREDNVNKTIENFNSNFNLEELKTKIKNELDEFLNQDDEGDGDEYEIEIKRG